MKAALDLLQSLRDFGWPIHGYIVVAPLAVFAVPFGGSRDDKVAKLLLVGTIITFTEVFFSIGTEGGDFIEVARLHPVWGSYVAIMMLVALGTSVKRAILHVRENRTAISLTSLESDANGSVRNTPRRSSPVLVGGWLAGLVVAVIWLSRIGNSQ